MDHKNTKTLKLLAICIGTAGLSVNILHAGDKLPAQSGFFINSTGDLLPALRSLGGLCNFCNYIFFRLCNFCNYIFFNHNGMLKSDIFYRFENYWILPKSKWLKKSMKTKNYITNYARYNYTIIQTLYKFLTTKKWL